MRERPSGKFVLRIPPDLHRRLRAEAVRNNRSLNRLMTDLILKGLRGTRQMSNGPFPAGKRLLALLRKRFGDNLLGVVLFGSQAKGEASPASDIDLLIVLGDAVPVERALYRWWDETVAGRMSEQINPQFIHKPASAEEAGGLWFEVALAHEMIWERSTVVSDFLEELRETVGAGAIRRYLTQGQPYWVWRGPML